MYETLLVYLKDAIRVVDVYAFVLTMAAGIYSTKKVIRLFELRHLRKIWGIKNKESVVVVCSELENPEERQNEELGEFIYLLKYGDVDAYFEIVTTLLRLYPNIDLRVLSSGEAHTVQLDPATHLILIGGPDYNKMTRRIFEFKVTRFSYKSPYLDGSSSDDEDIKLYDHKRKEELFFDTEQKDYGYFEKIKNPMDETGNIILIGGCHTIGVTGAAKAFSLFSTGRTAVSKIVLKNAKVASKTIDNLKEFSILFEVDKMGSTINIPTVKKENIFPAISS